MRAPPGLSAMLPLIVLLGGCRGEPASVKPPDRTPPGDTGQAETELPPAAPAVADAGAGEAPAWDRMFGGVQDDKAYAVLQTPDGGFMVAGSTASRGAGGHDAWVLRLDAGGALAWEKTYGGPKTDEAYAIAATPDGGFILAGSTESGGAGLRDGWLVKIDGKGDAAWEKTFGGPFWDELRSVQPSSGGGYVAAGSTEPSGAGARHVLVVRTDAAGATQWSRTFNRSGWDDIQVVLEAADGNLVAAGFTEAKGTSLSHDAWLARLSPDGLPSTW